MLPALMQSPLAPWISSAALSMSARLPLLGLSIIDRSPAEVLYISLHHVQFTSDANLAHHNLNFQLGHWQVDNMMPRCVYPVLLAPRLGKTETRDVYSIQVLGGWQHVHGAPPGVNTVGRAVGALGTAAQEGINTGLAIGASTVGMLTGAIKRMSTSKSSESALPSSSSVPLAANPPPSMVLAENAFKCSPMAPLQSPVIDCTCIVTNVRPPPTRVAAGLGGVTRTPTDRSPINLWCLDLVSVYIKEFDVKLEETLVWNIVDMVEELGLAKYFRTQSSSILLNTRELYTQLPPGQLKLSIDLLDMCPIAVNVTFLVDKDARKRHARHVVGPIAMVLNTIGAFAMIDDATIRVDGFQLRRRYGSPAAALGPWTAHLTRQGFSQTWAVLKSLRFSAPDFAQRMKDGEDVDVSDLSKIGRRVRDPLPI